MPIIAYLPKEKWSRCGRCGGSGLREISGNLHESSGIVPCGCGGGWQNTVTLDVDEYDRRARAGELCDGQGNPKPPHRTRYSPPEWRPPVAEERI